MDIPRIPLYNERGCVFKLFWGEKYVIVKCKYFARARTLIETGLKYFLKNNHHDNLYHKLFLHIKNTPFNTFNVEFLFKRDNPYELLKNEQIELDKSCTDNNCLNTSFEAYIPKYTQVNGKKSWINRGYYLNFHQWLKKRHQSK